MLVFFEPFLIYTKIYEQSFSSYLRSKDTLRIIWLSNTDRNIIKIDPYTAVLSQYTAPYYGTVLSTVIWGRLRTYFNDITVGITEPDIRSVNDTVLINLGFYSFSMHKV
jgi:DUF2075 family protein